MTQEQKHYYAFISYKREDKKEAKRLQHTLEYYKLPNELRQENPGLPEYVRPIFRDMTDLEVGELSSQIHEALEQSHFLIVVCSPRAAKSKWVNDEIEYFISIGKQEKIIPYIIEGVPHADNPKEECFPPALLALSKDKELLGANINEVGKDPASIRIVSRMFNIRFDTLYQRYQREKRRKIRGIFALILCILLLLLSFIAYVLYSNNSLKEKNCLIEQQNTILENQKNDLEKSRDSIIVTNKKLKISYKNLSVARDSLAQSNNHLFQANKLLKEEQEKVKQENWKVLENQARFVVEKANVLVNSDSYLARRLTLSILPKNLKKPNIPYVQEAEIALRNSSYLGITQLKGHTLRVNSIEFSRDGKYIVTASADNTIQLWDSDTGRLIRTLYGKNGPVNYASFSLDGEKIISVARSVVFIWDINSGEIIDSLKVKNGKGSRYVRAIAYKDDDNIIDIYQDSVFIWNLSDRKIVSQYGLEEMILVPQSIALSTDKSEVTYFQGNDASVFDLQSGKIKYFGDYMAYCPSSHLYVWNDMRNNFVRVTENNTQTIIHTFAPNVHIAAFDNKGEKLVMGYKNGSIKLCDTNWANIYLGHLDKVSTAVFSQNGELILSSSNDSSICIRNTRTHEIINAIKLNDSYPCMAYYFPNDRSIISATSTNKIIQWNLNEDGDSIKQIFQHKGVINDVHISPNGHWILSTTNDSLIIIINTINEQYTSYKLKFNIPNLTCSAFSLDSKHFAVATIGVVYVFGTDSFTLEKKIPVHRRAANGIIESHRIYSMCYSPDGHHIVTSSSDKTAAVWDVETGDRLFLLEGHTESVLSSNYSPDGQYIATASADGTIKVWKSDSGLEVTTITQHMKGVNYVSFSADGSKIISASDDKTIRVWPFPSLQQLINEYRDRYKDYPLTQEEKKSYYLE